MHTRLSPLLAPLALLLAAGLTTGQEIEQPSGAEAEETPIDTEIDTEEETPVAATRAQRQGPFGLSYISFSVASDYTFDADFKGADGDISTFRIEGGVETALPFGQGRMLAIGFSDEYSHYDVGGDPFGVGGGDDFKPHIESLYARYMQPLAGDWSMMIIGDFSLAGEWDADFDDKLVYGGGLLLNNQISEELTLGFGARVYSQIEDSVQVIPMFNIEWQIDERWLLAVGRGLTLSYAFDEKQDWTIDFNAAYESRRFRLDDDHAGRLRDGVIEDERVPLTVGLTYEPHRGIQARLFAGAVVWQQILADTKAGHEIDEIEADPAGYIGASFRLSF